MLRSRSGHIMHAISYFYVHTFVAIRYHILCCSLYLCDKIYMIGKYNTYASHHYFSAYRGGGGSIELPGLSQASISLDELLTGFQTLQNCLKLLPCTIDANYAS